VGVIVAYPLVESLVLAFKGPKGEGWVGFKNFVWALGGDISDVLGTNVLWLVVFPVAAVVLSLLAAVLFDKVKYEKLAVTIIVMPTAISFAAGGIIWSQMFQYQTGANQRGLLNALITLIPGVDPVPWLQSPIVNNLCLIFVALWSSIGVSVLILSAAVKSVDPEMLEAAQLDGAGVFRRFFNMILPAIWSQVLVVLTTQVVFALKVFDVVYVMTAGNFGTDVIARQMYFQLFSAGNGGRAAAIAVILLVVSIPFIAINIGRFRKEGAQA
jgi:alpha-glucoside transport system permease protein